MDRGGQGEDADSGGAARPGRRRLADRILTAFHAACDQDELELAAQLLQVLERLVTRRAQVQDAARRRSLDALVAAHERLWHLRHPGEGRP